MWFVLTRGKTFVTGVSSTSTVNSFCKGGRKISIGDCALFKLLQDSPPFIGIIRYLTGGEENNLKLGVNWLYRPVKVKLGKGSKAWQRHPVGSCAKRTLLFVSQG